MNHENVYKLLLLGAGESGKSTIFKQMKIIHQRGYSEEERKAFVSIVHNNVIHCIKILVEACENFEYDVDDLGSTMERVSSLSLDSRLTPTLGNDITRLWKHPAIQQTFKRSSEYQLPDSASYYLSDLDRICKVEFVPNEQDVLRTRVRTTGIVETSWSHERVTFKMFDVGGQRNERRKWIHCFDNVTAVIFVAALSEYDQVLFEDESQNRMIEALNLFDQICNSRWFHETAMILFLNKIDLFNDKIKHVNLNVCFPEYKGIPGDGEAAILFIENRFKTLNRAPDRQVYVHQTCATDTNIVKAVFEVVRDIVMQGNLKECGF